MGFITSTLSPNVNIQVPLRRLRRILKRVMVMLVLDMVLKTDTLSLNVAISVPLKILTGMLKIVMLALDMVL